MPSSDELVIWLRAQIDDQAARAWAIHDVGKCDALLYENDMEDAAARTPDCDCGHPAQVRAEVEAKRRIIHEYEQAESTRVQMERMAADDMPALLFARGMASEWRTAVEFVALTYASRPGYREEWRPA